MSSSCLFSTVLRPGIELRLLEERHAPLLFAAVNREREQLREWLSWVDATRTEDDIRAFIRGELEKFSANKGISCGIWANGAIAGVVTLHKIDWINGNGEIGYWLAREVQGCGIMTEAVRVIMGHGLVELDLNRIEIRCAIGNVKSAAIPKRLGFTSEGVLRQASRVSGQYLDLEVYSMLRGEYRS